MLFLSLLFLLLTPTHSNLFDWHQRALKKTKVDVIVAAPLNEAPPPTEKIYEEAQWGCYEDFEMNEQGICTRNITSPLKVGCQKNFVLSLFTGLCEGEEQVEALQVCPPSFLPSQDQKKNLCQKTSFSKKILICDKDYQIAQNNCEKQVIGLTHSNGTCPTGFLKDSQNRCIGYLTREPRKECPDGYRETGKVEERRTDKKGEEVPQEVGPSCEKTEVVSPITICIPGYEIKYDSICVKKEIVKPSLICEGGYVLDAAKSICVRAEISEKKPICRENFAFEGLVGKCGCPVNLQCYPMVQAALPPPSEPPKAVVPRVYGYGVASADDVDVITIQTPPIAPRTVYYPQFLVSSGPDTHHHHHKK